MSQLLNQEERTGLRSAGFFLLCAVTFLPTHAVADTAFVGNPSRINTTTRGSQWAPAVSSNAVGAAVVAWTCEDASSSGVCAQRYTLTGHPQGGELSVNTTTAGLQQGPDVAVDASGRSFVVWESQNQDGSEWGVYGQVFSATGIPVGGERRLNASTAGRQRRPSAVSLPSGGWVVVWESNHAGLFEDVYARLFASDGSPVSGEIRVNTDVNKIEIHADVAADGDGNFVVAWEGDGIGGGSDIWARRFRADGSSRGEPFRVNTTTTQTQNHASVSVAPDGSFAIAWDSFSQDMSGHGIYAQRFRSNGSKEGNEFRVNTTTVGDQIDPSAALSAAGTLVVTWQAFGQGVEGRFAVIARAFEANGPATQELIVNVTGQASSTAVDESGDIFIAYQDSGPEVYGRMLETASRCVPGEGVLCLGGERYKLEASWRSDSNVGVGRAVALTEETGFFWFFDPSNFEVVVKLLDGCGVNGRVWAFAAGLTNVEVDLLVTDTETGAFWRGGNELGRPFEPIQDVDALALCDGASSLAPADAEAFLGFANGPAVQLLGRDAASCDDVLCLGSGRYTIEVNWRASNGAAGQGRPVALTEDTGYFWFFGSDNVEILIKVLDGCPVNSHTWVFAGGLTNVEVEMKVTDLHSGLRRTYRNKAGQAFAPIQDVKGFANCS